MLAQLHGLLTKLLVGLVDLRLNLVESDIGLLTCWLRLLIDARVLLLVLFALRVREGVPPDEHLCRDRVEILIWRSSLEVHEPGCEEARILQPKCANRF
jgi:hypothetical protein